MPGKHDKILTALRLEINGINAGIANLEKGNRTAIKEGDGSWQDVTDQTLEQLRTSRDRFNEIADQLEAEDAPPAAAR